MYTNSMSYHNIFQSLNFLFRSSVFIKFFLNWLCHCWKRTTKDTHKNRKTWIMASDLWNLMNKGSQTIKKRSRNLKHGLLANQTKTLSVNHLNFDDGWLCLKFFGAHFTTKNISLIQQKNLKEGKRKSQREHLLSIYFKPLSPSTSKC